MGYHGEKVRTYSVTSHRRLSQNSYSMTTHYGGAPLNLGSKHHMDVFQSLFKRMAPILPKVTIQKRLPVICMFDHKRTFMKFGHTS